MIGSKLQHLLLFVCIISGFCGSEGQESSRSVGWKVHIPTLQQCRAYVKAALTDYWTKKVLPFFTPGDTKQDQGVLQKPEGWVPNAINLPKETKAIPTEKVSKSTTEHSFTEDKTNSLLQASSNPPNQENTMKSKKDPNSEVISATESKVLYPSDSEDTQNFQQPELANSEEKEVKVYHSQIIDIQQDSGSSQDKKSTQGENVENKMKRVHRELQETNDSTDSQEMLSKECEQFDEENEYKPKQSQSLETAVGKNTTTMELNDEFKNEIIIKSLEEKEAIKERHSSQENIKTITDDRRPKRMPPRSRKHLVEILQLSDIGTQTNKEESDLIQSILNDMKKIYNIAIKPLENLYKYKEISDRHLGDSEIFGTPMVLFLGPWSSGKSSIINYLMGNERANTARKTAPEPTDNVFTVISFGEKSDVLDGTELAADWSFASVQKFGQSFLDHFKGIRINHPLLRKVTLVDTPGINENRRSQERGYPFNDVFQWFIDHADVIYVVFDPSKLQLGTEMEAILDQLKGRENQTRFILNKADTIRRSEVMKVIGQLFWNLSPLMGSSEAPTIYAVSLTGKPWHTGASINFLMDQERALLEDLRETIDTRVENRIAFARRHAMRVRNHAKLVDCYLDTFYRHKSIFSNKKKLADDITDHPFQYSIFNGLEGLTNISRYDLPDPLKYRDFFRLHVLHEFKPLTSTCSYFLGCPLDRLDTAIALDLPELFEKYKKQSKVRLYREKEDENNENNNI
ncbi:sarcalumenin-like [Limulus polyphemus]|uniref:Sarcalumenin-like n=1 Tax=Limulus polyphemus TaxID=6850 RepID=A0ABM1BRM7_LIMPO|nr:sarcalumenin-like [Limulus polyphemus]